LPYQDGGIFVAIAIEVSIDRFAEDLGFDTGRRAWRRLAFCAAVLQQDWFTIEQVSVILRGAAESFPTVCGLRDAIGQARRSAGANKHGYDE